MTKEEIRVGVGIIAKTWPGFEPLNDYQMGLWAKKLADVDFEVFEKTVNEHYSVSRFAPHLSDLVKLVEKEKRKGLRDPDEAFQLVSQALADYNHNAPESSFSKLPNDIRAAIQAYGGVDEIRKTSNYVSFRKKFTEIFEKVQKDPNKYKVDTRSNAQIIMAVIEREEARVAKELMLDKSDEEWREHLRQKGILESADRLLARFGKGVVDERPW